MSIKNILKEYNNKYEVEDYSYKIPEFDSCQAFDILTARAYFPSKKDYKYVVVERTCKNTLNKFSREYLIMYDNFTKYLPVDETINKIFGREN